MARRLPVVLTDDELEDLLAQVRTTSPTGLRNKALVKVMAYGGLRVSEVVGLGTKDVRRDGDRVTLEVRGGKGGVDRTVPVADHVAETLEAWLVRRRDLGIANGFLFCTLSSGRSVHPIATAEGLGADEVTETTLVPGGPVSTRYLQALVPRLGEKAGLEKRVTCHVLRHTAATRLLRETGNLRVVQDFLGHANVATTQIYTHVLNGDVAEAVDLVPNVEAHDEVPMQDQVPVAEAEPTVGDLAAQALDALPDETRKALEAQVIHLKARLGEGGG